jgi:hypothetical protein
MSPIERSMITVEIGSSIGSAASPKQTLPGNLSMEDWQVMRELVAAVRQAIPDAAGAPPGAVLEHVLGALRAAQAKPIELSEE